jgi:pilus assembly protein CpaB
MSADWMTRAGRVRERVATLLRRRRQTMLLLAAIGLGTVAAFGARGYISEQIAIERERLAPRVPMIAIVVAKRDLARGDAISAQAVAVREIPRDYLAPGTVVPERFDGFDGARLLAPLRAGEALLQSALEGADISTFAAKVPTGVRAFTVVVDEVNSLSGMLQPGDRIDLLLSARVPPTPAMPQPPEITRALLQDLKVLATGRQVRPGGDDKLSRTYGAITVQVTPAQAQRLVVAQRSGKLTATLRNPQDREPVAQASLDVYALLGIPAPAPAPSAARPASTRSAGSAGRAAEVIIGGQGSLKPRPVEAAAPPVQPDLSTPPAAAPLAAAASATLAPERQP